MEITEDYLSAKGWTQSEIKKTLNIIDKARSQIHPKVILLNKSVYWLSLLLIIFGNFAFSVFLIPILITFNHFSLYFIIVLLASSFGILMSVIVNDIEKLKVHHHVLLLVLVPVLGVINFLFVVNSANNSIIAKTLNTHHNPFLVGAVYLLAFLLPFIYLVFDIKWKKQT